MTRSPDPSLLDLFEYGLLVQHAKRSAAWITRRNGSMEFLPQVPMRPQCGTTRDWFDRKPKLPN